MSEGTFKPKDNVAETVSMEEYNALKAEMAELKEARIKDQRVSFIEKNCSHLDEKILGDFKENKINYEQTLEAYIKDSNEYAKNVKESFTSTAPSSAGSASTDDAKDDKPFEPKDRNEAYAHVVEKYNIKGKKAMTKVAELYPQFFGKGSK